MLEYLNSVNNEFDDALNRDIMNKVFNKPLHEYIFESFKGFEIIPNIKILGYEWVDDESQYDPNDHIIRRNKNKNKLIKNITETRCGVMYIDIEISGLDDNGKHQVIYLKKPLIIPIADDRGYFRIRGKTAYIIYQICDKIMYPFFGAVTIKSLMPISVKGREIGRVSCRERV